MNKHLSSMFKTESILGFVYLLFDNTLSRLSYQTKYTTSVKCFKRSFDIRHVKLFLTFNI